ncbi:hypothetical protein L1887_49189 [Cichorium endivia]|nr:hypothetical protein L1887_49189 [Cichorium endivia]
MRLLSSDDCCAKGESKRHARWSADVRNADNRRSRMMQQGWRVGVLSGVVQRRSETGQEHRFPRRPTTRWASERLILCPCRCRRRVERRWEELTMKCAEMLERSLGVSQ